MVLTNFLIVKLEKPTDFSIGSIGADNVVLQWEYGNTTDSEPPLYYQVTYLHVGGLATTVTAAYQQEQLEYSMTLNNLIPNSLYEISVSAVTSHLTSDPLNVLLQTPEGECVIH